MAVCNDSQKILGFQCVEPISAFEQALLHVGDVATFVSLAAHRQGVGRSLSQATFQAAKEQGFKKLMATIRADKPSAVSFYRSQGFHFVGTAVKHALIDGQYVDELITEKWLD